MIFISYFVKVIIIKNKELYRPMLLTFILLCYADKNRRKHFLHSFILIFIGWNNFLFRISSFQKRDFHTTVDQLFYVYFIFLKIPCNVCLLHKKSIASILACGPRGSCSALKSISVGFSNLNVFNYSLHVFVTFHDLYLWPSWRSMSSWIVWKYNWT